MKRVISVAVVVWLTAVFTGCVTQKDLYPYDTRLYRLEQQLTQQEKIIVKNKEVFTQELSLRKDKAQEIRNQSASLTATLDGMKQETRQLKGQLEEIEYRQQQKGETEGAAATQHSVRIEQLEAGLETAMQRIGHLERYLNLESSSTTGQKSAGDRQVPPAKVPATEGALYQSAKKAFDKGDDETARVQFIAFLKKYPKSENADNSQFWIAEIFYREQWYEKAILEYQEAIEKYPKGNKAPDAMLKQGLAFYNLKDKANARLILKELIKKYPQTHASEIARKKLKGF